MRKTIPFGPFGGLFRRKSVAIPEGYTPRMLNGRCVQDGVLASRYGYRTLVARPVGVTDFTPRGFAYLQGYDPTTFEGLSEVVTIEERDGVVRPYRVDLGAATRTEIKNGVDSVSLPIGDYKGFAFGSTSYWIVPGVQTPLYKHNLEDDTSWWSLIDTDYEAPPGDPRVQVKLVDPRPVWQWTATDVLSYPHDTGTYVAGTITQVINDDGSVTLSGPSTDTGGAGGGYLEIVRQFSGGAQDFSDHDWLAIEFHGEVYLKYFVEETTVPQLYMAGAWHDVVRAKWIINEGITVSATWMLYVRGMANLNATERIRMRMACKPGRGATSTDQMKFVTIKPIMGGGFYLESTSAGHSLWDATLDGNGINYGFQYTDGAGADSDIIEKGISVYQAHGAPINDYTPPLGASVVLSCDPPPAGSGYDRVRFLRQDESTGPATWRILATVLVAPFTIQDTTLEFDVPLLPPNGTGTVPSTAPGFSTRGVVDAFAYKGRVVWLRSGGENNVSHSRIGEAEDTFDSEATPDPSDRGRPVDLSMAEDLTDEPVCGQAVGNGYILHGSVATYSGIGTYADDMQPPRAIPGSEGIVGRFASCACVINGVPGAAWIGKSGKVWFTTVEAVFASDATAKPTDLSIDLGYWLNEFLVRGQAGEFGFTDLSQANLQWDPFQQSLWVQLGKLAIPLRPGETPQWEPQEYALTNPPGSEETESETGWTDGVGVGSTTVRLGWTKDFAMPGNVAYDDGLTAVADMGFSDETKLLRILGLIPPTSIPVDGDPQTLTIEVQHEAIGDIACYLDTAYVLKAGVRVGANLGDMQLVPSSEEGLQFEVDPGALGFTVAEINAGDLGFEIGYSAEVVNPAAEDVANWDIDVTGEATATMDIDIDYTGPGPAPSYVFIQVDSSVVVDMDAAGGGVPTPVYPWDAYGYADNGLGRTSEGAIHRHGASPDPGSDLNVSASSTKRVRVALVGTHASLSVVRSGSGTGNPVGTIITVDYDGSAVFSPYVHTDLGVDTIRAKVAYDLTSPVPGQDYGIGWRFLSFTPRHQNLAFRTSGHIDEIEWNSDTSTFIDGINRDGGHPMPDGYRYVKVQAAERIRVVHVEVQQSGEGVELQVDAVGRVLTLAAGKRWVKHGVQAQGYQPEVGILFDETLEGVEWMRVEFEVLSRRY